MSGPDPELMRRWQQGDVGAFEQLVRRWQQPVSRFLLGLVGRQQLVGDLCQEVFLRVYHAGPQYRENGAFSAWLYCIARNVVRDAARRRRPDTTMLAEQEIADSCAPADVLCQQRELAHLMARAIAELPEAQRLVLVLRHYEQMSFEDIARLTATPSSTLKSRFAAALERLRVRLHESGWGPEEPMP